jgi:hypothetical protein
MTTATLTRISTPKCLRLSDRTTRTISVTIYYPIWEYDCLTYESKLIQLTIPAKLLKRDRLDKMPIISRFVRRHHPDWQVGFCQIQYSESDW